MEVEKDQTASVSGGSRIVGSKSESSESVLRPSSVVEHVDLVGE
jgi:hypothetical protein